MIRQTVIRALQAQTEALPGRAVADVAGLPYKATLDALGWLLDTGQVVRFGRKYSALWAHVAAPAACRPDPLAPVEAAWRAPTPAPHGGEAEPTPPVCLSI
jgi:hypothetical protein